MLRMGLQPLLLLFYPLLLQLLAVRLLRLAQLVLLTCIFKTVNSVPALAYPYSRYMARVSKPETACHVRRAVHYEPAGFHPPLLFPF